MENFILEYEYMGVEGWYIFLVSENSKVRAIKYAGPFFSVEKAEEKLASLQMENK